MGSDIKNITILTGAGISAESGIPVFRSETGLWEEHRVEDVATYEGFMRNPSLVHNFYNNMRKNLKNISPNPAHYALKKLQDEWSNGNVRIITQNIDDLHEKAGSSNVIHMHGELNQIACESCGKVFEWYEDSSVSSICPHCNEKTLRPNIVWFGEMPFRMEEIDDILRDTSLFLSIGTSGVVYPAAGFAQVAKRSNAFNIEFNLSKSQQAYYFDEYVLGKAGETLPKFVDALLKHKDLSFLQDK